MGTLRDWSRGGFTERTVELVGDQTARAGRDRCIGRFGVRVARTKFVLISADNSRGDLP